MIFGLISFLIAAFAFGYGAVKLFRKGKPMYLQLLVCASGCFALQQLSHIINLWCGFKSIVNIGMLGVFGCNFFLLSANFGTLDKIVDESKGFDKIRKLSIIAPVVLIVLTVFVFLLWKDINTLCAVLWIIILVPSIPASYFNLKHILLPVDSFGFLKATKLCNIAALVFYAVTAGYVISLVSIHGTISGIISILMSLSVLAISLCAVKGAEKWGI